MFEIKYNAQLFKIDSFEFKGNKYFKARLHDNGDLIDLSISSKISGSEIEALEVGSEYTFTINVIADNQLKPKVQIVKIER